MEISDLNQLEKESIERGIPIIGSVKGKWLLGKIKELNPKKILELGTANGYSGIILTSEGGELITIEQDERIIEEAKRNFKEFNVKAKVLIGNADSLIKEIKDKFDLIYLDHNKKCYMGVLETCLGLLNENGVIIADNISFDGCQDFKEAVLNHPKLKTEIIDIGDGLSYSKLA